MKAMPTKILFAAASLVLLAAVSVWYFQSSSHADSTTETVDQMQSVQTQFAKLTVNEPFKEVTTPLEKIIVKDPSQITVLTLASGSTVEVPANAFVDEQGQPVHTPVTIHFREFHNASDVIASGIPMRVRKANGEDEWMQTAGMFEIEGFTENRAVRITEGKKLAVSLVSEVNGAYDFWYFDKQQGNWINQMPGISPQAVEGLRDASSESIQQEVRQLQQATAERPVAPTYDPENNLAFPDLDLKACPNLKQQAPLVLNYAGKDEKLAPKNNKWITKPGIWTKKRLECTDDPNIFKLTLLGDSLYTIPVQLALKPQDLKRVKARYQELIAAYEANLQLLRQKETILKQQAAFRRTMTVQNFGIYNYDILWKVEEAVPLLADFEFGAIPEAVKELVTVYLITGEGRTIVGLPYDDWKKFRFSPKADNKLIAVLPGNKVAIFTQSDFKAEMDNLTRASGSSYVFKMRVAEQVIESTDDLNQWIKKASS